MLSSSTARKDRIVKLPFHTSHGVTNAWLVDPVARSQEAYELSQGHWMLIAALQDDAPVRVAFFAAIEFSLGDLWGGCATSETEGLIDTVCDGFNVPLLVCSLAIADLTIRLAALDAASA